ncbi:WhiB family transcriptional regulator [Streptomyces sp. NPDC056160]|uniref:WhiB family transcriptional regulator n=1 Tax=Streptomyces sp. NPDC056160 TaxID=3345731 RepID=UPI0035E24917
MPSMTSEHAQRSRRDVLQAAVAAAGVCRTVDPDAFFRAEGEQYITWQARRAEAIRVCTGCPVRAACEELALRDEDGRATEDDMVRGGLTGPELAAVRAHHAERLAAAVDADRDTEGQRLDALTVQLQRAAVKNPDKAAGHRTASRAQTAHNAEVRNLVAQIREIRTARRARTGWRTAA